MTLLGPLAEGPVEDASLIVVAVTLLVVSAEEVTVQGSEEAVTILKVLPEPFTVRVGDTKAAVGLRLFTEVEGTFAEEPPSLCAALVVVGPLTVLVGAIVLALIVGELAETEDEGAIERGRKAVEEVPPVFMEEMGNFNTLAVVDGALPGRPRRFRTPTNLFFPTSTGAPVRGTAPGIGRRVESLVAGGTVILVARTGAVGIGGRTVGVVERVVATTLDTVVPLLVVMVGALSSLQSFALSNEDSGAFIGAPVCCSWFGDFKADG